MERENHNATMDRNEISFLRLTAMSGPSNFNLVFIEIHISSEQQKGWALCEMSIVSRVATSAAATAALSRRHRRAAAVFPSWHCGATNTPHHTDACVPVRCVLTLTACSE